MPKEERDKRKYFIKIWLQSRYTLYHLIIFLITSSTLAVLLYQRSRRALRLEMFRGHSAVKDTWEILRPGVLALDALATAALIAFSIGITLAISWIVHRASKKMTGDLRSLKEGRDPAGWERIRHPREFRHLQSLLMDALRIHREHVDAIRRDSESIREKVRHARAEWDHGQLRHSHLRRIHIRCEKLKHAVRHFKIE